MQLILGRKFKLPVWEVLVKNMVLNEVAQFIVDRSVSIFALCLLFGYLCFA